MSSGKVMSNVPKCEKAVTFLRERIHVLEKLHSGMSYGAIGCESNVNELINSVY